MTKYFVHTRWEDGDEHAVVRNTLKEAREYLRVKMSSAPSNGRVEMWITKQIEIELPWYRTTANGRER